MSQRGFKQGDPAAPMLFCGAIAQCLKRFNEAAAAQRTRRRMGAYMDDANVRTGACTLTQDDIQAVAQLKQHFAEVGLELNLTKSRALPGRGHVVTDHERQLLQQLGVQLVGDTDENQIRGAVLLGVPVGHSSFVDAWLRREAGAGEAGARFAERCARLTSPRAMFRLLRYCVVPRMTYCLRTIPTTQTAPAAKEWDRVTQWVLEHSMGLQPPGQTWRQFEQSGAHFHLAAHGPALQQARLPTRHGGLGITSACDIADAAYVAGTLHALQPALSGWAGVLQQAAPQAAADNAAEDAATQAAPAAAAAAPAPAASAAATVTAAAAVASGGATAPAAATASAAGRAYGAAIPATHDAAAARSGAAAAAQAAPAAAAAAAAHGATTPAAAAAAAAAAAPASEAAAAAAAHVAPQVASAASLTAASTAAAAGIGNTAATGPTSLRAAAAPATGAASAGGAATVPAAKAAMAVAAANAADGLDSLGREEAAVDAARVAAYVNGLISALYTPESRTHGPGTSDAAIFQYYAEVKVTIIVALQFGAVGTHGLSAPVMALVVPHLPYDFILGRGFINRHPWTAVNTPLYGFGSDESPPPGSTEYKFGSAHPPAQPTQSDSAAYSSPTPPCYAYDTDKQWVAVVRVDAHSPETPAESATPVGIQIMEADGVTPVQAPVEQMVQVLVSAAHADTVASTELATGTFAKPVLLQQRANVPFSLPRGTVLGKAVPLCSVPADDMHREHADRPRAMEVYCGAGGMAEGLRHYADIALAVDHCERVWYYHAPRTHAAAGDIDLDRTSSTFGTPLRMLFSKKLLDRWQGPYRVLAVGPSVFSGKPVQSGVLVIDMKEGPTRVTRNLVKLCRDPTNDSEGPPGTLPAGFARYLLAKHCHGRSPGSLTADDVIADPERHGVEAVLRHRLVAEARGRGQRLQYLVRWEGDVANSWEDAFNMDACPAALHEYWTTLSRAADLRDDFAINGAGTEVVRRELRKAEKQRGIGGVLAVCGRGSYELAPGTHVVMSAPSSKALLSTAVRGTAS
ncbi:hypothetical protein JKP88DRAFT_274412 [Tribonema minus]|uniref:Chromo domain-containing protein n=1 Tax=Tribonema minus TaxID=303371 RepID=A0A835YJD8_9STRA|nr:hypothetical protein JKP88DRAFT_274412 [Tribonema minus]